MANSSKLRSFPDRVGFVERIILARYTREEARRGKATRVFILDETGVEDRCVVSTGGGKVSGERRDTKRVVRLSCSFHPLSKLRLSILVFVAATVIVGKLHSSCETVDARPPI